ncbi:MAG: hypothetical protein QNJ42_08580 [Crocosphaera sp.]|nr:hypothetical protein [Crocosphaera sp.]
MSLRTIDWASIIAGATAIIGCAFWLGTLQQNVNNLNNLDPNEIRRVKEDAIEEIQRAKEEALADPAFRESGIKLKRIDVSGPYLYDNWRNLTDEMRKECQRQGYLFGISDGEESRDGDTFNHGTYCIKLSD